MIVQDLSLSACDVILGQLRNLLKKPGAGLVIKQPRRQGLWSFGEPVKNFRGDRTGRRNLWQLRYWNSRHRFSAGDLLRGDCDMKRLNVGQTNPGELPACRR